MPCRLLDNLDSYSLLRKVLQSSLLFWQSCECAGKCFQQEFSCALHYKKVNFLWNTSCPVGRILRHQVLQIINCRVLFSPRRIEFSRSKVNLISIKRFKLKINSNVLFFLSCLKSQSFYQFRSSVCNFVIAIWLLKQCLNQYLSYPTHRHHLVDFPCN